MKSMWVGHAVRRMTQYDDVMGSHAGRYNRGRCAHAVGDLAAAVSMYRTCLQMVTDGTTRRDHPRQTLTPTPTPTPTGVGELCREAAHNLALIYASSGATEKANDVLRQYCTF